MPEHEQNSRPSPIPRKPPWLRKRLPSGGAAAKTLAQIRGRRLHTICEEGCCPNQGECFSQGVATFLILGNVCTRNCAFCAVGHGRPPAVDPEEPDRVALQTAELGLSFVVVTSVTRDDLPDGGAGHFAATTRAIKEACPGVGVEVLVPDFAGSQAALQTALEAEPAVLAHNLETVPRLYSRVRPGADYSRSLELIRRARQAAGGWVTKSGLMVGLGETTEEILEVLADLRQEGCQMITIGQYLAPSPAHHPVKEYVPPEAFSEYEEKARQMGFAAVASGPFVRSSYLAEHFFNQVPQGPPDQA
ncbi:MAG: lipoyl synthase [Desulfarculaceae bacterium]